jgi:DNA-3-methyladenine glycosylase
MGELNRSFFDRHVLDVAPELLGAVLVHRDVAVRLTEVEAYDGAHDPASHAFRGRTARNAVMFGEPGHAYVYFTYGMHFCVNLVCGEEGRAAAVLLRAGEIVAGIDVAQRRRPAAPARDLARGPARLTKAMDIDRALDGADVCAATSPLRIVEGDRVPTDRIRSGPRVGVSAAADRPWRWWIDGDPTVSPYRPHAPRRRRNAATA